MKSTISLILTCILVLFLAVLPAGAEAEPYQFTEASFPVLDGSTSMVPLGEGIASVLLGRSREDVSHLIAFNRTTQSFRNLMNGCCDVVIAAEPKSTVFEEMEEAGFPYLMETIAKEALVFVVNEQNPVNSLTIQQVRDIYSGAITNWKDVGGEDAPIEAFQRNATAGSQVMMEKLVMGDTPMMEAPSTHMPVEMAGLIEAVRSYDNSANAIGYTVFYYATDMQMAQGLKILEIDGVLPSVESIQAEQYPYINGYYCCISKEASPDSPARRLFDWLISEDGQTLLKLEGYVPVCAGEQSGNIVTDFSHYAPIGRPEAAFALFDCPHDHLEPSESYGLIYPYSGPIMYSSMDDEWYWDWELGRPQGFYNHEGQLITNPVYSSIERYELPESDSYFWHIRQDGKEGFAAKDGSFLSDICYQSVSTLGRYIQGVRSFEDYTFDIYDSSFRLVATEKDFPVPGGWLYPYTEVDGVWCGPVATPDDPDDFRFALMDSNGHILVECDSYIGLENSGMVLLYDSDWNLTIYDLEMNPIRIGDYDRFNALYALNDYFYYAWPVDGDPIIIDRSGNLFAWGFDDYSQSYSTKDFVTRKNGTSTVYSSRGRMLFNNIPASWDYLGNNIFLQSEYDHIVLHKYPKGESLTIPGGTWAYAMGDYICVSCYDSNHSSCRLVDQDLTLFPEVYADLSMLTDAFTGKQYLQISNSYGFAGEQRLLTADTRTELIRTKGTVDMQNGFLTVSDDWSFRCYKPDGTLLFCYPYYGMNGD